MDSSGSPFPKDLHSVFHHDHLCSSLFFFVLLVGESEMLEEHGGIFSPASGVDIVFDETQDAIKERRRE